MSKELPPSRRAEQFVARFPDGLRDQLATVAKSNGRSMNAEITARLQSSFDTPASERINELERALAKEQLDKSEERIKVAQYASALRLVADRLPANAFDDSPLIAAILKDLNANREAQVIATLEQMAQDKLQTLANLHHMVETGAIKIVKRKPLK